MFHNEAVKHKLHLLWMKCSNSMLNDDKTVWSNNNTHHWCLQH